MAVLGISLILLLTAFMIHVMWWRVRIPAREVSSLIRVFIATFLSGIVASGIFAELDIISVLHITIFFWTYSAIYFLTYTGLQGFGPSFIMLRQIEDAGVNGVSISDFAVSITDKEFIERRIDEMIAMGWLTVSADELTITTSGRRHLILFTFYRSWVGRRRVSA
jgi:hypothetical protein